MSQENVNIVRVFLDASMRRDWTRVAELVDPDVELQGTVGGVEEGRVYRGLAEVIHEYEEVDGEAWEERRIEPEKFLDAVRPDDVAVSNDRRSRPFIALSRRGFRAPCYCSSSL